MKNVPNYHGIGRSGKSGFAIPPEEQRRLWAKIEVHKTCWVWKGNLAELGQVRRRFVEQRMLHKVRKNLVLGYSECHLHCVNWKHIREFADPSKVRLRDGTPPETKLPPAVRSDKWRK